MSTIHLGLLLLLGSRSEGDIIHRGVRAFAALYIALSSVLRTRADVCHGSGYADSPCTFDIRVIPNVIYFCAENRTSVEDGHVCHGC
jgi:hypothetical protein